MEPSLTPLVILILMLGLIEQPSGEGPAALAGPDSDRDGIHDTSDACPDTPRTFPVLENGCAVDSDGDGVADGFDRCPETEEDGAAIDRFGCSVQDRKKERAYRYMVELT